VGAAGSGLHSRVTSPCSSAYRLAPTRFVAPIFA
jgi:hypothetical protein